MNPQLADAARQLLSIPKSSSVTTARRAERLQRLADVLDVLALWPHQRRTKGVHPMDLEVARAEMALRGDEAVAVARRIDAFRYFMSLAADRAWTEYDWRPAATQPPALPPEITDEAIQRRDAIRAAMGQWRAAGNSAEATSPPALRRASPVWLATVEAARPTIVALRAERQTFADIAKHLNAARGSSRRGITWTVRLVQRALAEREGAGD